MRQSGNLHRFAAAFLLTLLFVAHLAAQEVKFRAPRIDAASEVFQESRETIEPPDASLVAPSTESFALPPAAGLPSVAPSVLPPDVVMESTPPPTGFDPLSYFFERADDTLPFIEEWEQSCEPIVSHLVPQKPGLFQKFGVSGSWVEGGTEDREPAMTDFSTFTTFAVPFPIREWPLHITPGFDMRLLDGPTTPDLPPRLYDAYVDFTWNLRVTQRSTQVFSIAPGYYSDFERSSGKALRVTGKWVGAYDVVKHRITLITGTLYLGRQDVKTLVIGGLVFTPNHWSRFEAVFPNPRASLKLRTTDFFEDWIYAGADFYGGQTWSIERADDTLDRVTILDNRMVLGLERRRQGGAGWHIESGWVFDREVRYRNNSAEDFSPDPTFYVRAGFTL